jgi:hypothetical protein
MTQSKRFTKGLSLRYYSGRTRKRPEGAVRRGSLELCTTTRLIGWAIEDDQPGVLEVFVGEERVAGIRCDRPRPDLAEIGARTDAGFVFVFNQPTPTSQSVRVCFADGTLLANTPATPTRYESSIDARTGKRLGRLRRPASRDRHPRERRPNRAGPLRWTAPGSGERRPRPRFGVRICFPPRSHRSGKYRSVSRTALRSPDRRDDRPAPRCNRLPVPVETSPPTGRSNSRARFCHRILSTTNCS